DRAQAVVRLVDDEDLFRCLDDLERLGIDVILQRSLRQTQAIGIVQSVLGRPLPLEIRRPGLKRQIACIGAAGNRPYAREVWLAIWGAGRRPLEIRLAVSALRSIRWMRRPLCEDGLTQQTD